MTRISLTETAQQIIGRSLSSGQVAIDATLGNGHDALFLARTVGAHGHVFGFDIQEQALGISQQRLANDSIPPGCVSLFQASHAEMTSRIPVHYHGRIQAVMFNLGYLPGSDKSVITRTESTLAAIAQASQLLANGGVMTLLAYPKHAGGETEAVGVHRWLCQLDPARYACCIFPGIEKKGAPRLFHLVKH